MNRRSFLKRAGAAGAAALGAGSGCQRDEPKPPADAVGMLYDATKCIGCKACVVACREANGLAPRRVPEHGGIWDEQLDLDANTKTVIKLYREGDESSYIKPQCMHCIDPACESACMIGALQKREHGIVTYDADLCIGCRYCQVVCPFGVPAFEWSSATPRIVKCEMCNHLIAAGRQPACCEVCPREAVIFGDLETMRKEARQRLARHPDRYVDRIYGEREAGGTQVLFISAVPFEKLGLPALSNEPVPKVSETVQHGIYYGFLGPAVLYGALGFVLLRNRKRTEQQADEENEP